VRDQDRRLRPALVGEDGDRRRTVDRMARHHSQQVLRLVGTIRQSERAQPLDSPGFLVGAVGEGRDHQFPFEESVGGLSAFDVHDAGCQYRCGKSVQRLARPGAGRIAGEVEEGSPPRKARVSNCHSKLTNIGISTFPTSTSAARSITCAACLTATAGESSTGTYGSR
jgi:hypothetical protein